MSDMENLHKKVDELRVDYTNGQIKLREQINKCYRDVFNFIWKAVGVVFSALLALVYYLATHDFNFLGDK